MRCSLYINSTKKNSYKQNYLKNNRINRYFVKAITIKKLRFIQNNYFKSRFEIFIRVLNEFFRVIQNKIVLFYRVLFSNRRSKRAY